jgi:hypothetical protein
MLASLAKEAGPDSVEQVAWEYLKSAAKGIRVPGQQDPMDPANPVFWNRVVQGITIQPTLQGQDLLNAAAEEMKRMGIGATPDTLALRNSVLNASPDMHRQIQAAYDRKLARARSMGEAVEEGKKTAREKFAQAAYERKKKNKEFQKNIADLPWAEQMAKMRAEIEKNLSTKEDLDEAIESRLYAMKRAGYDIL